MVSKSNDRIADLLAAYGSDITRWPEDDHYLVDALTSADRAVVFADARALDQLLSNAASTADNASPSSELMARIMQVAEAPKHKSEAVDEEANVVSLNARKQQHQPSATMTKREWTAAAALLAASLVLGIFVGSNERIQSTVLGIGEIAGVRIEPSSAQISALDAALQTQDDEDLL